MGLYDDLIFKYPVPGKKPSADGYQTYDLGCKMDSYEVTKEGQLYKIELDHKIKIENFNGIIDIYNIEDNSEWFEYKVEFINGKVKSIEKLKGLF